MELGAPGTEKGRRARKNVRQYLWGWGVVEEARGSPFHRNLGVFQAWRGRGGGAERVRCPGEGW